MGQSRRKNDFKYLCFEEQGSQFHKSRKETHLSHSMKCVLP